MGLAAERLLSAKTLIRASGHSRATNSAQSARWRVTPTSSRAGSLLIRQYTATVVVVVMTGRSRIEGIERFAVRSAPTYALAVRGVIETAFAVLVMASLGALIWWASGAFLR